VRQFAAPTAPAAKPIMSGASSPLLLTLALAVSILSIYTAFGWSRHAAYVEGRARRRSLLLSGVLAGLGLWLAAIAVQASLHQRASAGPLLLGLTLLAPVAVLMATPWMAWARARKSRSGSAWAAVLAASGIVALHGGMAWATALRPGPEWRWSVVAVAAAAIAVAAFAVLRVSFAGPGRRRSSEPIKLGVALALGTAVVAGQWWWLRTTVVEATAPVWSAAGKPLVAGLLGVACFALLLVLVDLEHRRRSRRARMRDQARRTYPQRIDAGARGGTP
jgi:NO-binding membrane sensor protein with MHYT domain